MQRGALEERPHQFMGIPRQRVGPEHMWVEENGKLINPCSRARRFFTHLSIPLNFSALYFLLIMRPPPQAAFKGREDISGNAHMKSAKFPNFYLRDAGLHVALFILIFFIFHHSLCRSKRLHHAPYMITPCSMHQLTISLVSGWIIIWWIEWL